jgi:hypothetical protein
MYWIVFLQLIVATVGCLAAMSLAPGIRDDLKNNWNEEDRFINAVANARENLVDKPVQAIVSLPLVARRLRVKTTNFVFQCLEVLAVALAVTGGIKFVQFIWTHLFAS